MVYRLLVLLALLLPTLLAAQLQDDFSDGDLTTNPQWFGDTDLFTVNTAGELQLSAPAAGSAILYTPLSLPDSLIWTLYARLNFAPSTSNLLRIYLQADDMDLLNSRGYYLEIGESGSGDAIRLFRQDEPGNAPVLLASGIAGSVGSEPATARIQISRNAVGRWVLQADYSGNNDFQTEAIFNDATYGSGNAFFGFYCQYTSTRTDKFFFDDINVRQVLADTLPPQLIELQIVDESLIDLVFNESLSPASASNANNYLIDKGVGLPASAAPDFSNPAVVHLELTNPLQNGETYILTADQISDLVGNTAGLQQSSFTFFKVEEAAPFDLLITEIMADPNPVIGLPDAEYFEIFNNSGKFIELSDLRFIRGTNSPLAFSAYLMEPGDYVIVCDDSNDALLTPFGKTVALANFPALTNSGDRLQLETLAGVSIHSVDYSIDWYQDNDKDEGGWSLEMISPGQVCQGITNWRASSDPSGGSPGRINAVFESINDLQGPKLLRAFPSSENQVRLYFDKALDPFTAADPNLYHVAGLIINSALVEPPQYTTVLLETTEDFIAGQIYELIVAVQLTDCLGNLGTAADSVRFGLAQAIEADDLILNEILYYPAVGGARFIELYNRSNKIVNTAELLVASRDDAQQLDNVKTVDTDYLLFPGEYVVFSPEPIDIISRYSVLQPSAILETSLPSFDNKADEVVIYTTGAIGTTIIDELSYTEDFHNPLLDNERGVSIERINPEEATQSANNWHSAAQSAGFATPTYLNSQFMSGSGPPEDLINIPNPRLSPDGDGFEDFLQINYQTDLLDYTANIRIFDTEGRLIKNLVSNEILAARGQINWDGDTEEGGKARIGIYIIFIELFTPEGNIQQFKKSCVLAGRLE